MDGTGKLFDRFVPCVPPQFDPIIVSYDAVAEQDYPSLLRQVLQLQTWSDPFVVVGESFSGPIAIRLAAKSPNCFGVILAASFARCPVSLPHWTSRLLGVLPHAYLPDKLVGAMLLNGETDPSLLNELSQVLQTVPATVIQARMKAVISVNATDDLRSLRAPVLYLQASRDRLVGQRAVRDIMQAACTTTVVQIKAPHMILQTQPEACAASIGAWILKNELR